MRFLSLVALAAVAVAQDLPKVVYLEPATKLEASFGAEFNPKMPLYRAAGGRERYDPWLKNDSAERALALFTRAAAIADPGAQTPPYYIALVPKGNHAAIGFRLEGGGEYAKTSYVVLDPQPWRFETTLLHETGHVVMTMLAGGRQIQGGQLTSVPHTTASLSDRATAFSEGYAIHLETLAAHLAREPHLRQKYHREMVAFGAGEYYRHASDLASYSQNVARYGEVRDNNYAFESAFREPDYLRVQLEKARDFATVRDANQLLQSEGFYASFFFLFVMRGSAVPGDAEIAAREERLMRAMSAMFRATAPERDTPWLAQFVVTYMRLYPEERSAMVDALNDLSHGVFVDPAAAPMWREHYLACLRLDLAGLKREAIDATRTRWREQVLADPQVLFSRLGPQIACTVDGPKVRLVAFGGEVPLRFDANTAQEGVLKLIPGITDVGVSRWLAERGKKPFASAADLRERGIVRPETLARLKFASAP